mmetsp:Transcript_20791/g.70788  ORF Transcript_20791/g.70788 Transcript_20791/m.70788 type:complete len:412 (-) Transcript_20791:241-1476(-)
MSESQRAGREGQHQVAERRCGAQENADYSCKRKRGRGERRSLCLACDLQPQRAGCVSSDARRHAAGGGAAHAHRVEHDRPYRYAKGPDHHDSCCGPRGVNPEEKRHRHREPRGRVLRQCRQGHLRWQPKEAPGRRGRQHHEQRHRGYGRGHGDEVLANGSTLSVDLERERNNCRCHEPQQHIPCACEVHPHPLSPADPGSAHGGGSDRGCSTNGDRRKQAQALEPHRDQPRGLVCSQRGKERRWSRCDVCAKAVGCQRGTGRREGRRRSCGAPPARPLQRERCGRRWRTLTRRRALPLGRVDERRHRAEHRDCCDGRKAVEGDDEGGGAGEDCTGGQRRSGERCDVGHEEQPEPGVDEPARGAHRGVRPGCPALRRQEKRCRQHGERGNCSEQRADAGCERRRRRRETRDP